MHSIQFVGTTPEQLSEFISKEMKSYLDDFKHNLAPKKPTEYLTRAETADLLKINISTLYLWTKKGVLNSYGISGKVYYKRNEVEAALTRLQ